MVNGLVVRRVEPHEGPRLREVRLAALRDAPEAFASDADEEAAFDAAVWDDRAVRGATDAGRSGQDLLQVHVRGSWGAGDRARAGRRGAPRLGTGPAYPAPGTATRAPGPGAARVTWDRPG